MTPLISDRHTVHIGAVEDHQIEVWCSCGTVLAVVDGSTLDELNRLATEHAKEEQR